MKRVFIICIAVVLLLTTSGCSSVLGIPLALKMLVTQTNELPEAKVKTIAISLNEELNFNNKTSEKYNLQYSNFHYETDGYNRYIAVLHYQYEDAKRNYQSGDVIVYFTYDPQTDKYRYTRTNIKFPGLILDEAEYIEYIKQDEQFGWGSQS